MNAEPAPWLDVQSSSLPRPVARNADVLHVFAGFDRALLHQVDEHPVRLHVRLHHLCAGAPRLRKNKTRTKHVNIRDGTLGAPLSLAFSVTQGGRQSTTTYASTSVAVLPQDVLRLIFSF